MNDEILQRVQQVYGVENWSAGYFDVNAKGNVVVRPVGQDSRQTDLKELVDELLGKHRLKLPLLIRFPQMLTSQLRRLTDAYQKAIQQYSYRGQHYPVFPMKVNPRREVVEEFLRDSSRCRVGLECGSKAELYAAVAQTQTSESLMLCNGFKDDSFLRTALLAVRAGKRVTIVVEKLNELKMVL
ncbi:MAG: arginine decarboxylase, partial [Planctomycetes bacterium]|nr:arginine decarboxylase [Planctomycetota bacterium]